MFEIKVSQEIKNACPVFAGAAVYAAVKNTAYCDGLWKEINTFTEDLTTTTQMADIKTLSIWFLSVPDILSVASMRIRYRVTILNLALAKRKNLSKVSAGAF